jgi:hypothetical protein
VQGSVAWQPHERRLVVDLVWGGLRVFAGGDQLGGGARSRVFGLRYQRAF